MFSHLGSIHGITIGRFLRWTLIAQAFLAGFLVLSDIEVRWLPRPDQTELGPLKPVTPGDQRREFNPGRTQPRYTETDTGPQIVLPAELPRKMEFRIATVDYLGDVIFLHGPIEPGDSRRFDGFLAALETTPDSVVLNSPGGAVSDALAIGRTIRTAGLDTVMLRGMGCMSACPYMLAAGVERRVSRAAFVGMHQHYYETPGYLPVYFAVEDIQHGQGETVEFLIEMGVDPGLIVYSLKTPPDEIYLLVEKELLDTRLATEITE